MFDTLPAATSILVHGALLPCLLGLFWGVLLVISAIRIWRAHNSYRRCVSRRMRQAPFNRTHGWKK